MNYTHLILEEKSQIYTLLPEGFSKRYIACRLNRSPSTISREINRNRARNVYFAQHKIKLLKNVNAPTLKESLFEMWVHIITYLYFQWSPEQIASHVPVKLHSIYRFIRLDKNKGGSLFHNLRFRNQRKCKYCFPETRGQLSNRKSIHNRPIEIEGRTRFGNLEIDMIVGMKQQRSLESIVDWKTGYLWLKKCSSSKAEDACHTAVNLFKPMKDQLKTITANNGKEFSLHEHAAEALEIDWYFTDPYSAWQKGTNENTNGLIRQYIKKGSDLKKYSDAYI